MDTRRSDSNACDSKVLLALLGGAALGAVAMALIAPRTGQEVRATLRSAARRLLGQAEETDEEPVEAHFI
jgi:gas vesicle protein